MDIFEATQSKLTKVAVGANVTHIDLTYDERTESFRIPECPAVTWLYSQMKPEVTHSGGSGLYRVLLDVEIWGSLDDVAEYEKDVLEALNARRAKEDNVIFTIIVDIAQDIVDVGLDCKHRLIRFSGMVQIKEKE